MAAQPEGPKWVGNAGLIIGLPWDKRKSLPRDSKGFEPIEGYFDRTTTPEVSDSDSSETDTEELLRQEREKRIEAEARKRAVEEAKRNAEYLMKLVAAKKQAELERQKKGGEEREEAEKGRKEEMEEKKKKEVEGTDECDDERDVTLTEENCVVTDEFSASGDVAKEIYVGSNVEVFAKVVNGSGNSEQLYSPISSLALQDTPPSTKKNKFVPARLTYSGDEKEHSSDSDRCGQKKSQGKRKAKTNLQSTFLAASDGADTVPLPSGNAVITQGGHIMTSLTNSRASFNPTKTSTQLKNRRKKKSIKYTTTSKKKPTRKSAPKKLPSAIRMELSDSESERDETLAMLLAGDTEHFQGLSQLTVSKLPTSSYGNIKKKSGATASDVVAAETDGSGATTAASGTAGRHSNGTTTTAVGTASRHGNGATTTVPVAKHGAKKNVTRTGFAKKSTGNMAHQIKKTSRKSVTFVAGSESETEVDHVAGKTIARTDEQSQEDTVDVYMSFEEDHYDSPKQYKPRKGEKPKRPKLSAVAKASRPVQRLDTDEEDEDFVLVSEETETDEYSLAECGRRTSTRNLLPSKSNRSKRTLKTTTTSEEEEVTDQHARVSETPETVPNSPRGILKEVSLVMTSATIRSHQNSQPQSPPSTSEQWYIPDMLSFPRKKRSTAGKKETKKSDQQKDRGQEPRVDNSKPQHDITAASGEKEVGKESESTLGENSDIASNAISKPKKKRGQPSSKSVSSEPVYLVSSESDLNGHPDAVHGQDGDAAVRKMAKSKAKRGKSQKMTSTRRANVSASSESELDEWLEAVREKSRQQDPVGKEQAQRRQQRKKGTAGEWNVQVPMPDTKRRRRVSPRKAQTSASSESDVDIEAVQGRGEAQPAVYSLSEASSKNDVNFEPNQRTHSEAKRGRGRPRKYPVPQPPVSSVSESEQVISMESGDKGESQRHTRKSMTSKHSAQQSQDNTVKRGRGQPPKSALPPPSTTSESELEENTVKEVKRRGRPPRSEPSSESDGASSRIKKARNKIRDLADVDSVVETSETGMELQQNFSDYGDGGGVSPPTPPSMYESDLDVGSKVNPIGHQSDLTGSTTGKSVQQVGDHSENESIDVSVIPRLKKRKHTKGSRVNLPTKRQKKNKPLPEAQGTPSDQAVGARVYSMSMKSGEETEEASFEGMEIIKSAGGRRYRRLRVEPKSHTPGVRRSNRTRVAPVRHWENEIVEYDTRRKSGVMLKGVLVPVDKDYVEGEEESEVEDRRKRNRTHSAEANRKRFGTQEDREFSPLRFSDPMGDTKERTIIHTLLSAPRINCSGEPVTEDSNAEVIIHQLNSNHQSSKGVMTFASLGEKPKSSTRTYDMFFYVIKGKLLFQVNKQEFVLLSNSSIDIPGGCVYSIRNMQHSEAQILFSTHYIEPRQSD